MVPFIDLFLLKPGKSVKLSKRFFDPLDMVLKFPIPSFKLRSLIFRILDPFKYLS
jgi:hypothetical protein